MSRMRSAERKARYDDPEYRRRIAEASKRGVAAFKGMSEFDKEIRRIRCERTRLAKAQKSRQ
jgi:phage terminase Nu1 subunit (DNA packaging protein)